MATRELLLTILVTVIVAISVAIAFQTMNSGDLSPNRSAVLESMNSAIGQSRAYYDRPVMYGGGQHSYQGITFKDLLMDSVTAHGTFQLSNVTDVSFTLTGIPQNTDIIYSVTVYRDSVVWE